MWGVSSKEEEARRLKDEGGVTQSEVRCPPPSVPLSQREGEREGGRLSLFMRQKESKKERECACV